MKQLKRLGQKMKDIMYKVFVAIVTIIFSACSTSTNITSTWQTKTPNPDVMEKVMVLAIVYDREISDNIEKSLVAQLSQNGVEAYSAIELFGPQILTTKLDGEKAKEKLAAEGYTSVMLVNLKEKEQEENYNPGSYYSSPEVVGYSRYYRRYVVAYNQSYTPGSYSTSTNYLMEANLFGLTKDELVYSAQSRSYDPSSAKDLADSFSKAIVKELVNKGLTPNKAEK